MTEKSWQFKPEPNPEITQNLARALQVPRAAARLLVQRGVESFEAAKQYFRPDWTQLHDPFLMKDMDRAVARIQEEVARGNPIMVFGDYDVDGTTSVSLMMAYLKRYGIPLTPYIPDRYQEGYGISKQGIDTAKQLGIGLIIALDCGIKANDQVAYAKTLGIDFIICDHHLPGETWPEAAAVLDPKRPDCPYPYKELCGCGVGFKLIQALHQSEGHDPQELSPFLDLVVTAIAADIVPITGENRTLAYLGLKQVNEEPRPGLAALLSSAKSQPYRIRDLVFVAAPRINAAGRIKHGAHAVELLLAGSAAEAQAMAEAIERYNLERRSLDQEITQQALDQIINQGEQEAAATVVYDPNWHKGVVGIVASRLIETYYRPTVVFTQSGDHLAASVRSVKGFDVYQALEACSGYMLQFGGHKYAAGLTLDPSQFENFKQAFNQEVARSLTPEQKVPQVAIDLPLPLSEITPKLFRILSQMAPFGPENARPVFAAQQVHVAPYTKAVGADLSHLRLVVHEPNQPTISGIAFGYGAMTEIVKKKGRCDVAYVIDENHWQGQTSLQLMVKDVRV
ncbi:single-stranded-DNA-specific exonuclease RecJ [Flavobacteriaceae bacterium]|nr:single-stranded-DNA-specific exonuclease RecJ [Flavobacteriaceae bacterium]